jgi:prepilin-type N-terminal cleavage/methylation domain-containing protein
MAPTTTTMNPSDPATRPTRIRRCARRAFNLIELLIALAITAALLGATMVALDASFTAYQTTTEEASTHTIGRLIMHRILAMIRTGQDFAPFPVNPRDSLVTSDFIEFLTPAGQVLTLEWVENDEALYVTITDPGSGSSDTQLLLEGVIPQFDADNNRIPPFTLQFEKGRELYRATVDLAIVPDDNMSVELDGDNTQVIRLVASAMPRMATY